MAGLFSAIRTTLGVAFGGFRRVYADPSVVEGGGTLGQQPSYRLLWQYYSNEAFENVMAWGSYKGQYHLYRQMRMFYNPTRRLCDFYATHLYPGVLAATPADMPDGTQMAIPLSDDTTPEVRLALDQLWAWSRWQANKSVLCRYGAVAGSVLVEAIDDIDSGLVYMDVLWPSLVSYLDLSPTGEIIAYSLSYPARDENNVLYEYRKDVDAYTIAFFKDEKPFDYGEGLSYDNPYGFVPAVWIKHKDLGSNMGAPAIHGTIGKIDELNSLASHIHDQVHKVIGAPIVLWTNGKVGSLFTQGANASAQKVRKRPGSNPNDPDDLDREGTMMLTGPEGGRVDTLAGQLQLKEAAEHLTMLLTEIEADHPEVAMYRELRSMSQVTGPAASRLMGDVAMNVGEAAANYDAGCAQVFAMCLAIGGWRVNNGDWGDAPTAEQAVFAPFNLDLYRTRDLKIRILPRALIALNEIEALELQQLRDTIAAGVPATLAANIREQLSS